MSHSLPMPPRGRKDPARAKSQKTYALDQQVGFILRQVTQRHTALFASSGMADLTPMQWAALAKLHETGCCSQNLLGRLVAMDAATVKGVIQRLLARGYVLTKRDPSDARRVVLALTPIGTEAYERLVGTALRVTRDTLAPLTPAERQTLLGLLSKLR
jgi:DNA-binding MarR family transcriptional regulator